MNRLEELIVNYGTNKSKLDKLKKLVDADNSEIKSIMTNDNINEYSCNGYTVKLTVQNRESINEIKLLELLQSHESDIPAGIIKVKPYVDTDALESAIYNGLIPQEILVDMNKCKETKKVNTLKVSESKEA